MQQFSKWFLCEKWDHFRVLREKHFGQCVFYKQDTKLLHDNSVVNAFCILFCVVCRIRQCTMTCRSNWWYCSWLVGHSATIHWVLVGSKESTTNQKKPNATPKSIVLILCLYWDIGGQWSSQESVLEWLVTAHNYNSSLNKSCRPAHFII